MKRKDASPEQFDVQRLRDSFPAHEGLLDPQEGTSQNSNSPIGSDYYIDSRFAHPSWEPPRRQDLESLLHHPRTASLRREYLKVEEAHEWSRDSVTYLGSTQRPI